MYNQITESFNFNRVKGVMDALEWEWFHGIDDKGRDIMKVPSEERIKQSAKKLLTMAYEQGGSHSSGGLWADYEEGTNELSLSFILTSWLTNVTRLPNKKP